MLTVPQTFEDTPKLKIPIADYDCLGMIYDRVDTANHESRYVRNVVQNEVPIRAHWLARFTFLSKMLTS
jgi:hypothetical protein